MVSCADKIHNLLSLQEAYKEQGEDLWKKFNAPEDKKISAGIELVMLAEDYTRPQAIETICDLVKSEYAVKAEHRKERTA